MPETFDRGGDQRARHILIGDDQCDVLEALRLLLKFSGYKTETVDSPEALLRAAAAKSFDLILMDLNYARDTTSGQEGLELLERLQLQGNVAPIVVMTAWGSVDLAVEAMRRGASDFVQKPWDNNRLLGTVAKQLSRGEEQVEAGRKRRSELDIARHVQQKLFPQKTYSSSTLLSAGHCRPAREIGGDYYDFLPLTPGKLGVVLGDVSGKGIGAALLMAHLQASFRSQLLQPSQPPAALVSNVNRLFYEATPTELYATLFFGAYDESTRELRYVNCGHLPPVLVRQDGSVDRLEPTGTVVGLFPQWSAEERTIRLQPGDTLAIFSDGVTEACDPQEQEFGDDRVIEILRQFRSRPIDDLTHKVADSACEFGGIDQRDDITIVGLRGV